VRSELGEGEKTKNMEKKRSLEGRLDSRKGKEKIEQKEKNKPSNLTLGLPKIMR
jgi:hypothetical protein